MFKKFITWLYKTYVSTERGEQKNCYPTPDYDYGMKMSGSIMSIPAGTYKAPDMPKSLEGFPIQDIQEAAIAIQNSRAVYSVGRFNDMVRDNHQLKDWEVKIVEEAYSKFAAKYCSPLAKAMK